MGDAGVRAMKRPPRFTIAAPPDAAGVAQVADTETHHMRDVMRLREGAEVFVLDPAGMEHRATILRFDRDRAVVRISAAGAARAVNRLVLAAAIIKGPRMDFIVEKAAELGASELWPTLCARGVAGAPGRERLARWRRLAMAAAKQSLAPRAMLMQEPLSFADLIRTAPRDTLRVICTIAAEPVGAILRREQPRSVMLACGPEGDFDRDEHRAALAAGFVAAGLGPNRLRSETAALAALSITADFLYAAAAVPTEPAQE
jgi:16S rRNA (uracil1498-N3)-methyltransferase